MKEKKVPQRGLGVAQLEKIREEQQKKEATLQSAGVLSPNPVISPSNSSSCLGVHSSSSLNDTTSPNSMFRTSPSIPFTDILHPNSVPFSKPLNVSASVGGGNGNWPRMWNGEHNLEWENLRLPDHQGFSLSFDLNLFYESNPHFLRLPSFPQGPRHFQRSSPSSSLMNVSTGISSSPVVNFQMEHPSIQRTYGSSNYTPLWLNEEKIIGMKRPYPFSMETPPAPPFHLKYPPSYVAPISRIDESASFSNRSAVACDPGIIREVPTKSIISSQPTRKEVKENHVSNVDFLSLGPPAAVQPQISSGYKQVLANSGHQGQGMFDSGSHQSRESNEDSFLEPRSSKSIRTSFFSFLPSTRNPVEQNAALMNNCSGEVGETVDLSLKL